MYRVIIGGNLVRLPSAIPDSDTILLSVKDTGLRKLIRVRVIFIICLKLIIVDIKYHLIDFSYYIQNYYLSLINYGVGGWGECCFE